MWPIHEIDLKNPKTNRKNAGFTDEERAEIYGTVRVRDLSIHSGISIRIRKAFIPGGPIGSKQERRMPDGVLIIFSLLFL